MATTGGPTVVVVTILGNIVVVTTVFDLAGAIVVEVVVVVVGIGAPLAPRTETVVVVGAIVATEFWPVATVVTGA